MIGALSINQLNSPIAIRERFSGGPQDTLELLSALQAQCGGVVALSTCNRFEIYASEVADKNALRAVLARTFGVDESTANKFDAFTGLGAAEHAFRVACGLESAVVGESEILGQVRKAYSAAVDASTVDPVISHLFHQALRVGRKARAKTAIGRLSVSVSSLAARSARDRLGSLNGRGVLVIGAGEAGQLAAQALADLGAAPITIVNRTDDRAQAVAEPLGGSSLSLSELPAALCRADVVVSATGAGCYLVSAEDVCRSQAVREGSPAVFVDIGAPRDIEPAVASIPGVTLMDLDDLSDAAAANQKSRAGEVADVEAIIAERTTEFGRWLAGRTVIPTVAGLTAWAEDVRARQVGRAFKGKGLSPEGREALEPVLDGFSRALVQQLLHRPIAAMRSPDDGQANADAVRAIFGLEEEEELAPQ